MKYIKMFEKFNEFEDIDVNKIHNKLIEIGLHPHYLNSDTYYKTPRTNFNFDESDITWAVDFRSLIITFSFKNEQDMNNFYEYLNELPDNEFKNLFPNHENIGSFTYLTEKDLKYHIELYPKNLLL